MKTIGKKSTVLLLVLAILGTCFMSFGWSKREKAQALASDIDTIYYLTDYYPTLSYDALYYEFGDSYEYQYELKALDETILYDMVHTGFFADLAENHLVIIDIKLFKPDVDVLSDLFFDLKVMQGCMTVFVSAYASSAYANTEFLDYVDLFVADIDMEGLTYYVESVFALMREREDNLNEDISTAAFLIDGNLIGTGYNPFPGLDALCASSPFLSRFMEIFVEYLATERGIDVDSFSSLTGLFNFLRSIPGNKIRMLVHISGDSYLDLLTGETFDYSSVSDALGRMGNHPDYVYGFGVIPFTPAFRQFLLDAQHNEAVYMVSTWTENLLTDGMWLCKWALRFSAAVIPNTRIGVRTKMWSRPSSCHVLPIIMVILL